MGVPGGRQSLRQRRRTRRGRVGAGRRGGGIGAGTRRTAPRIQPRGGVVERGRDAEEEEAA